VQQHFTEMDRRFRSWRWALLRRQELCAARNERAVTRRDGSQERMVEGNAWQHRWAAFAITGSESKLLQSHGCVRAIVLQ
jgi:hypothetical protein